MIAKPKWINASNARQYHQEGKNNYYGKEKEFEDTSWLGKLSNELGFNSIVTQEQLQNALYGRDAQGNELLNSNQLKLDEKGDRKRATLDLTFNAPKSVSILVEAAMAHDRKDIAQMLIDAHDGAVAKTILKFEERTQAREYNNDGSQYKINTGNMLIATFRHDIARPVTHDGITTIDPSLHTHALVFNMTKTANNEYKAIESKTIFEDYMTNGQYYRNELASSLKDFGLSINITDAKKGFFEIDGVSKDVLDELSKRSEQINDVKIIEELREKYPNKSFSEIKQLANYKTRDWKDSIDRNQILEQNANRLENVGFTKEVFNDIFIKAKENAIDIDRSGDINLAKEAIMNATIALTSQNSVFTKDTLLDSAIKLSLQHGIKSETFDKAYDEAKQLNSKDKIRLLISKDNKEYITTKEMIDIEKSIISSLHGSKNMIQSAMDKSEAKNALNEYSKAKEHKTGFGLTQGQLKAAEHILSSKDLVIGIQGDAGTGKTTMLKAVHTLIDNPNNLIGLSYTGKASSEIEKATASTHKVGFFNYKTTGIKSSTIASFINSIDKINNSDIEKYDGKKLIIDEASMLGIRDAKKLIDFAQKANAQVILMGDFKQFKAINAGDPFSLLQKNGMKTVVMDEVIRQKKEIEIADEKTGEVRKTINPLWLSTQAAKEYDTDKAFVILDKAGKIENVQFNNNADTIDEKKARLQDIVFSIKTEYFKKIDEGLNIKDIQAMASSKDSLKDGLIITDTNEIKNLFNEAIRNGFIERENVSKNGFNFKVRDSSRIMPTEAAFAQSYKDSTHVFLQENIITKEGKQIEKGVELEISDINTKSNIVFLISEKGERHTVELHKHMNFAAINAYKEEVREFAEGDKIVFEKNDSKLNVKNGQIGIIKNIDKNGNIKIVHEDGKQREFSLDNSSKISYSYINHGYAITSPKSQGQTTNFLIAYLDSSMQNFNSFYVALTRATHDVKIFTDSKEDLQSSIKLEQLKLNALDVEINLQKHEEAINNQVNEAKFAGPMSEKQMQIIAKLALSLKLEDPQLNNYGEAKIWIQEHFEAYKSVSATPKQIDLVEKIANTKSENIDVIKQNKSEHIMSINPNDISEFKRDDYLKDLLHKMQKSIEHKDVEIFVQLETHYSNVYDVSSDEKGLNFEAYAKILDIKSPQILERILENNANKISDTDMLFVQLSKNPYLEASEVLKKNDIDYKIEKIEAMRGLIIEAYESYSIDKIINAVDGENLEALEEKVVNNTKDFTDKINNLATDLKNEREIVVKEKEFDILLENGEIWRASKIFEGIKENLLDADIERLEDKLNIATARALENRSEEIESSIRNYFEIEQKVESQKIAKDIQKDEDIFITAVADLILTINDKEQNSNGLNKELEEKLEAVLQKDSIEKSNLMHR